MFLFILVYLVLVLVRPQEYPELVDLNLPLLPVTLFLALVGWLLSKKNFQAPQYLLICAFLLVMMLSQVANGWAGGAIEQLTHFGPVVASFVVMANAVNTPRRVVIVMAVFVLCSTILAVHGIEQAELGIGWTGMPLVEDGRIQYVGIFSDPNDLGLLFAAVIPMAFYLSTRGGWLGLLRLFWLAAAATLMYGVYLTASRGALLAVAAIIGAYIWRRYGRTAALVLGGLGFAAINMLPSRMQDMDASESSAAGRVDAWYEGIQMFMAQPFFGVGSGNFTEHNYLTAHNSFVLVLAEMGFFGFTVWLAFVGYGFMMTRAILRHQPTPEDDQDAAAWKLEQELAATLFVSQCGFYVAAFFLSRSYVILLYLLSALVVGDYASARQRFPSLPVFSLNGQLMRWPMIAAGSIVALYILVRILL
ncbi:MAG: O-antigen ligase family protein [Dokdonella sp.]